MNKRPRWPVRLSIFLAVSITVWGCVGELPLMPRDIEIEWEEYPNPWLGGYPKGMAVDSEGSLFLAKWDHIEDRFMIEVSKDGGRSWQERLSSDQDLNFMAIDGDDWIFCTGYRQAALVSRDQGLTWRDASKGLPDDRGYYRPILDDERRVVLISGDSRFVMYDKQAEEWYMPCDSLPWSSMRDAVCLPGGRVIVSADDTLFYSDDEYQTWDNLKDLPWESYSVADLAVLSDGRCLALAWGTLYRSIDGGTQWEQIPDIHFTSIKTDIHGGLYGSGSGAGLQYSPDGGDTWTAILEYCSLGYCEEIPSSADGTIFLHTGDHGIGLVRSDDAGVTWERLGLPAGIPKHIARLAGGETYLCLNGSGIFRLDDEEAGWVVDDESVDLSSPRLLEMSPWGDLYAGSRYLFRKDPEDQAWSVLDSSEELYYLKGIAFPGDTSIAVMTYYAGVAFSSDMGASWEGIGMEDYDLTGLAWTVKGGLFVSADFGGVFRYTGEGRVWEQLNDGLESLEITALASDRHGDLLAGTEEHGLYRMNNMTRKWKRVSEDDLYVTSIAVKDDDVIFGARSGGLYWSCRGASVARPISLEIFEEVTENRSYANILDIEIGEDGYIFFIIEGMLYKSSIPIQEAEREMVIDGR